VLVTSPPLLSECNAGIGLRLPHVAEIATARPHLGFIEVHAENYMAETAALDRLLGLRRDYPVSVHGVALSLGSAEELDRIHLGRLKALIAIAAPPSGAWRRGGRARWLHPRRRPRPGGAIANLSQSRICDARHRRGNANAAGVRAGIHARRTQRNACRRGGIQPGKCLPGREYGADFADFLAGFEPCKDLPYRRTSRASNGPSTPPRRCGTRFR
jgi:hypothetical protein